MFISVDRYVKFLADHKITQAQFMMCYLIYRRDYDTAAIFAGIFPTNDGTMIGKGAKDDLLERGFLVKKGEGDTLADYSAGDTFLKAFVDKYEVGDQFWDVYPSTLTIKGVPYPLTLMDKYEFRNLYVTRIGYDRVEHEEVLKDLAYGKIHGLVNCGIEKFVRAEHWKAIRKLRLGQETAIISDHLIPEDL